MTSPTVVSIAATAEAEVEAILRDCLASKPTEVLVVAFRDGCYYVSCSSSLSRTKRLGALELLKYEILSTNPSIDEEE